MSSPEQQEQEKPSPPLTQPPINTLPTHHIPKLDPAFVQSYTLYSAGRLATHQIPISSFRANPERYVISYGRAVVPLTGVRISDVEVEVEVGRVEGRVGVRVRVFEPEGEAEKQGGRGAYVNFHGGGWVFGGLETDFEFCKRIVRECGAGVVVFDVDYRLAPEYGFPCQVEDCWEVLLWIHSQAKNYNLDTSRIAIGGCSAGGHLAAVLAHMCRDNNLPLRFQLLTVPVCDLSIFTTESKLKEDQPYNSYREFWDCPPLTLERMSYFHTHFLGPHRSPSPSSPFSPGNPLEFQISPIKARNFKDLAEALVITAECDVLRDEGEAYARKLEEGGNKVEVVRVRKVPHTFMQMDGILEGGRVYNRLVVGKLREVLGGELREEGLEGGGCRDEWGL